MTLNEAIGLYRKMRNTPTYEGAKGEQRLEIAFDAYPANMDIEDVWHDLERQCSEFSVGDAMNGLYNGIEMTEGQAYIDGWNACNNGVDGRYTPLAEIGYDTKELRYAWSAGFHDSMEREEEDEEPEPECAGFGPA